MKLYIRPPIPLVEDEVVLAHEDPFALITEALRTCPAPKFHVASPVGYHHPADAITRFTEPLGVTDHQACRRGFVPSRR
jgi:hypothetical protein